MNINGLTVNVKIQDTELFKDIISLIKKYGENNIEMMTELTEIMSKHSTEHEYSIND